MSHNQFLLTGLFWMGFSAVSAQAYWNFSLGYQPGDFQGLRISVDVVRKDALCIGLFFGSHWKPSPATPDDYESIRLYGSNKPQITLQTYSLLVGGAFSGGKTLRYVIRGGPALNFFGEPANFRKPGMLFVSSYTYDLEKTTAFGIVFSPRVEFLPAKQLGISAGVYANINAERQVYGLSLDLLIGRLRG